MAVKEQPNGIETSPPSVLTLFTEIIVEILLRLPVDSVLRCKSVCKSWCSIISDPKFIKSHLALSTGNYKRHRLMFRTRQMMTTGYQLRSCRLSDVFCNNSVDASYLKYPQEDDDLSVEIVGSCNGLVCVSDIGAFGLYIWNPSTRKFNILPNCEYEGGLDWYFLYGFGYEESTDDYKVVEFSCNIEDIADCKTFVRIYSLNDGTWKEIGFPHGFQCYEYGMFSNGALHWSARNESKSWTILSMDLATETYGEILQPAYDAGDRSLLLGSLGEWLFVLCSYEGSRSDLWVLKDCGLKESWTKLVSIPYMNSPDPWMDDFTVPLCISNDGKLVLQFRKKMFVYDSRTGSISEIENCDVAAVACTFVESLVSPMPGTSLGDRN